MINSNISRFKKGDTAICVINSRATLTVGKEYKVKEVYTDTDYRAYEEVKSSLRIDLVIDNDRGVEYWYDQIRFITKDEFRNHKLNEIIK